MSGINPNYKGCVFCGQEECDCPYTGKEIPTALDEPCPICHTFHTGGTCAGLAPEPPERDFHQHGCICADCSGAELTSEND